MDPHIGIFYFSGTGNTEIVSKLIQQEFITKGSSVDIFRIEDIFKNRVKIDFTRFDLIGIGNPVIGFGTPEIIYRFIKILPSGNGKKIFLVKTAGGVGTQNYPASRPAIRQLRRKGYDVFYDRILALGSNWVVKFDDRVVQQLYATTRKKIEIMCSEIKEGKRRTLDAGILFNLLMETMMVLDRILLRFIGKDLHAAAACNLCGSCLRTCPVENIIQKKGTIRWQAKCNCCMRCVYTCPKQAIHYRMFSFFELPGGLNVQKVIDNPETTVIPDDVKKPPFLENYVKNDNL